MRRDRPTRSPSQVTVIPSALTLTVLGASGRVAGPRFTAPVAMSYWLPWQPQLIVPSETSATMQPIWVHTAENALNSPDAGWVMTTLASARTLPPPTGTCADLTAFFAASVAEPTAWDAADDAVSPALPHAARAPDPATTAPMAPAPRRTVRRSRQPAQASTGVWWSSSVTAASRVRAGDAGNCRGQRRHPACGSPPPRARFPVRRPCPDGRASGTVVHMELAEYQGFTDSLTESLGGRPEVLGLVALGSMALRDYAPDRHSDHDFFVVTRLGAAETLRSDLSWLPDSERISFSFRETSHGLKVLYDSGHLLELAVFEPDELALARVNRYRVLLDRADVTERLAAVAAATSAVVDKEAELDDALSLDLPESAVRLVDLAEWELHKRAPGIEWPTEAFSLVRQQISPPPRERRKHP